MSESKQCTTCHKNFGILTCNGCRQAFCGKHVLEHRQYLTNQLEDIMQNHDLLLEELQHTINEQVLLEKINQWEKTSLTKIQIIAENNRIELRRLIEDSNRQLSKACSDIASDLRCSRHADDFCETDLTRWIQQLDRLKHELTTRSSIQIIDNEQSAIHAIKIQRSDLKNQMIVPYERLSLIRDLSPINRFARERFAKVIGPGKILDNDLVVKCTSTNLDYAFVLGEQMYLHGKQTIRFRIGQAKTPYNIFLGCIASHIAENDTKIHYYSPFTVGWFGCNEIYQHGTVNYNSKAHGYRSDEILSNDVLQLTMDCDRKQIELFQERTNKHHCLSVNTDKTPLPWRFLLVLNRQNDYIRILSL
ncbi:unnamed protein product [Adineta ricciae]|uniref:B box-type domain-containing protein n=1 Tax=Adineta ricciae TaxID=249248 RepID=A0A815YLZ9_ADIRI|nr:unnamed protein product [Adineta ricciae]CAF1571983.1 unnamed protein product [Adineta ricciae]